MKKLLIILFCLISLSALSQTNYYVSPWTGSDADSGLDTTNAWATWQKAFNTADAGDTVKFLNGVWYPQEHYIGNAITIIAPRQVLGVYTGSIYGNSGTKSAPIVYMAYPGAHPVLDCSQVDTTGNTYNSAIDMYCADWIEFRGLEVRNVYQTRNGTVASGIGPYVCSNLTFENVSVHDVGGRAFSPSHTVGYFGITSDTTRWINCDAYNIIDSLSSVPGNAGDGWKFNGEIYDETDFDSCAYYFIGCRAWNCSDDGFDPSGSAKIIIQNSWSFYNGHYGEVRDGNGFKSGGVLTRDTITEPTRVVTNCIAAFNTGIGFYDLQYNEYQLNYSRYYNNVSYKNGSGIQISTSSLYPETQSIFRNNIIYGTHNADAAGRPENIIARSKYVESHNTWDYADSTEIGSLFFWKPTDTVTVTTADWAVNDSLTIYDELTDSRQSDGRLPVLSAFRLVGASDLLGAGKTIPASDNSGVTMSTNPSIGIDWSYYDLTYGAGSEDPPDPEVDYPPTIYSNNAYAKSVEALLGGNITSDGGAAITERGVVWATSANPTTSNNKIMVSGTTGSYTTNLTGLTSNTTYHVRSYATNSAGTSYGADVSFTTTSYTLFKSGSKLIYYNGKQIVIK